MNSKSSNRYFAVVQRGLWLLTTHDWVMVSEIGV